MVRSQMQRYGWAGMPAALVAILVLGLVPLFAAAPNANAAGSDLWSVSSRAGNARVWAVGETPPGVGLTVERH